MPRARLVVRITDPRGCVCVAVCVWLCVCGCVAVWLCGCGCCVWSPRFVGAINEFPNEKAAVAELRHLRTPSKGTIGPNASKILYRLYTTPDVQHYHPPIRGGGRVA